jgi:bla regulator protein blaR1
MTASWMVYVLLVSVLIAAGARGIEELLRALRLPVRYLWMGALLGTLVLAALAPLRTGAPVAPAGSSLELTEVAAAPAIGAEAASPRSALSAAGALLAGEWAGARSALRAAMEWPIRAAAPLGGGAVTVLWLGWLTLSLALLALGAATLLRSHHSRRAWPIREIAATRVRIAPATGPAVLGLFRPEIVVPEWLLEAPEAEQRLVVLHEEEHVRARDTLFLTAGCLAVALVPWNPAGWWMLLRLRLAVEIDCDVRVLRRGVQQHAYGTMLIDMAGRGAGLSLGVPALSGSPSNLERRLLAMRTKFSGPLALRASLAGVLGSVALLTACEADLPTTAEVQQMDVAAVEQHVQQLRMVRSGDGTVAYFVDGVEVSAEEARAIAGDRIARIEAVRDGEDGRAMIRLRTREGEEGDAPRVALRRTEGAEGEERTVRRLHRTGEGEGEMMVLREGGVRVPLLQGEGFEGLLVIDGVISPSSMLRGIAPESIERVEVIKGEAAGRLHDDPRAAHGVIQITTKGGAQR